MKKNKLIKITAFYDSKGENILNSNGATLSYDLESADVHRIGGDSGGFLKNSKPFKDTPTMTPKRCESYPKMIPR